MKYSLDDKRNIIRNRIMEEHQLSAFNSTAREIRLVDLAVNEQVKEWHGRDYADMVNAEIKETVDFLNSEPDWEMYE